MADNLEAFNESLRQLKLRHPEWFGGQVVKEETPVPRKASSGPTVLIVEAPKKDYWDHDDGDRNDI